MSYRLNYIIFAAVLMMSITCRAYPGNYWEYYENLNGEDVSAYGSFSGNTVFDFIPFEGSYGNIRKADILAQKSWQGHNHNPSKTRC